MGSALRGGTYDDGEDTSAGPNKAVPHIHDVVSLVHLLKIVRVFGGLGIQRGKERMINMVMIWYCIVFISDLLLLMIMMKSVLIVRSKRH